MRHKCRKQCSHRTLLCDLPRNVLDEILMCLPFRDVVRTSILSKKWRNIWHGLPVLTLSHTLWKPEEDLADLTSNLVKIINHILIFHTGPVTKFTLCVPYLDTCPNIDNLIRFLSRNDIQHLVLRLPIRGSLYKMPLSFFTCFELRHLTLQNCSILAEPSFKGFDRLISLELCDVAISSKLLERLISRSLLLEQLVLQISGASSNVIEISAPNLRSFDYTGNIRSVCLKNIPRLAKLSLSHREYYVGAGKCNIAKFFEFFSALEHLHLNDMFFVAGAGEVPTRLSYDLYCVKHLCISSIHLSDPNEVSCALCLIRSFPNLQSMEIKVECDDNDIPALESLEVERFSDVTMKSGKGHHVEEEEDEYDFGSNRDATPSSNSTKDGKNSDKANAIRSKHSVTEQRRRSKINERFQMLRNLIPHTDQKRDTASFLFEVIQYVQYLQDTVQKYEGSYQPWSSEPTKLMPWRNSQWHAQSFPANPQALINGTDTGPTYSGRFDENLLTVTSSMQANQRNPLESHPAGDVKSMDQEKELARMAIATSMPLQASMPVPFQNDSAFSDSLPTPASDECPSTTNALNNQEFMVEGGTINFSNTYSQGLLNSLTQALQATGLDLSHASISVQINLGKRANKDAKDTENPPPAPGDQFMEEFRDINNDEELDPAQKRLKK
ncbi:hypothetical protein KY290_026453 [Solanum tuberosum]|uniref:F-box domain-containing protein n=1 Tax=Solanum tuberosum TaxID=4113 RepID=A0ABQ7UWH7_SOLTU|nr:hypothetical protein KY290_026453 [Solanum tuberosum]